MVHKPVFRLKIRAALIVLAVPSMLVIAGPAAQAADDAWSAEKQYNFICGAGEFKEILGGKEYSQQWYKDYMEVEDRTPYKIKSGHSAPTSEARLNLYGSRQFNPKARKAICKNLKEYADEIRRVTPDVQGEVKDCCHDEEGLEKFFKEKENDMVKVHKEECKRQRDKEEDEDLIEEYNGLCNLTE